MADESSAGYRQAPSAPRPYEHTARLPRSLLLMNLFGGLVTGLFIAAIGYRYVEIRCDRKGRGAPIDCAVTAVTVLGGDTRHGTVREGARAAIVQRRSGRSQTYALGVLDEGAAQPVPLTPAIDRALGAGDYERMVPRFDAFLRDRSQATFEDRTQPNVALPALGAFLAAAGVACALLIARWRRTIRVVRGASPRIEIESVGLLSGKSVRTVEAGPGARVTTRPAPRGLTQLVLERADRTTHALTMGRSGDPRVDALVAEMNEALSTPIG